MGFLKLPSVRAESIFQVENSARASSVPVSADGRAALPAADEDGRRPRHNWNVSQRDSDEWRAFRQRRKPTDEEWAAAKSRFTSGVVATGAVLSHHPFGFFVDLGDPIIGLVEIVRVKEPRQAVDPRDYPPVGQEITAVVIGVVDLQRQVHLSIRPSDLATS
jgi:ribosomal protein S1